MELGPATPDSSTASLGLGDDSLNAPHTSAIDSVSDRDPPAFKLSTCGRGPVQSILSSFFLLFSPASLELYELGCVAERKKKICFRQCSHPPVLPLFTTLKVATMLQETLEVLFYYGRVHRLQ